MENFTLRKKDRPTAGGGGENREQTFVMIAHRWWSDE